MKPLLVISVLLVATIVAGVGCSGIVDAPSAAPTVDEVRKFIDAAEKRLDLLSKKANRAD